MDPNKNGMNPNLCYKSYYEKTPVLMFQVKHKISGCQEYKKVFNAFHRMTLMFYGVTIEYKFTKL